VTRSIATFDDAETIQAIFPLTVLVVGETSVSDVCERADECVAALEKLT